MKYWLFFFLVFCSPIFGLSQTEHQWVEGKVTYSNSQNVYIQFNSTQGIATNDTLYLKDGDNYIAALVVKFNSSISCVCQPIIEKSWDKDLAVFYNKNQTDVELEPESESKPITMDSIPVDIISEPLVEVPDTLIQEETIFKQKLRGRISASTYSGIEDFKTLTSQRMRYSFSLHADHLKNSKISYQNYITFRHKWDDKIQNSDDFFNALKIYNLAIGYKPNENNNIWLGRRVNNHITNIGAIDGLQYAHQVNNFSIGGFIGARPDYRDYRISVDLPQAGVYLAHEQNFKHGFAKTTLSFVEQRNQSIIDRRFLYFQHSNAVFKNIHIFSSFELDLYKFENQQASAALIPTSLYVSLRYRPNRKFSIYGAYDNRRRVIYYESYKHLVDQLLEEETRQGLRMSLQYKLTRKLSLGASGNYRFQNRATPSRNAYAYLRFSRVPWLKINTSLSYNYLETSYLNGQIFGMRANRDLIKGKLSSSFNYRHVRYLYKSSETRLDQNIAGINLSWRIMKSISASINFEGSFQKDRNSSRIYVNTVKRFR